MVNKLKKWSFQSKKRGGFLTLASDNHFPLRLLPLLLLRPVKLTSSSALASQVRTLLR
ncbi:hypothetical protein CHCC5027_4279 [Bacillus paralicheniformis]|nr:hypothetical protein CHCC5027_4279 [Bacillus paralicheniformis]